MNIIVIGAGVIGCSVAYELSKYNTNVVVLEKNDDVGDEASGANSGIVHSGYDPIYGSHKALLNVISNQMFDEVVNKLDVEFIRNGSLTLAFNEDEKKILLELHENAIKNGVETHILDFNETLKIEKHISKDVVCSLYAPTCGVVNPFELTSALIENAILNGVSLKLNEEVINIKYLDDLYYVTTKNKTYTANIVINCCGCYSDEINSFIFDSPKVTPRKGEYFVLDKIPFVNTTLFGLPSSKGKGVLITKTTSGNYLIGPSSEFVSSKDSKPTTNEILNEVLSSAKRLVDYLPIEHNIRQFSGLRAYINDDFQIKRVNGFIYTLGIASPGLASSLAISLKVVELVKEITNLTKNENYIPTRQKVTKLNNLSVKERNELIKINPDYGKIICVCENISLGEIKDLLNRVNPPSTFKGVKKRIRCGFGKCQGGFCETKINRILNGEYDV